MKAWLLARGAALLSFLGGKSSILFSILLDFLWDKWLASREARKLKRQDEKVKKEIKERQEERNEAVDKVKEAQTDEDIFKEQERIARSRNPRS